MNRRQFLAAIGGAGAATAIGVPLISGISGSSSTGRLLASRLPLPRPFTRPLPVPGVLTPTRSGGGGDFYEVVQRPGYAEQVRTTGMR